MINSDYRAPLLYRNGHMHTIIPTLFRKVEGVDYQRERIATPDDDFLDLDWSKVRGDSLAIISHGLEGHTGRAYIKGMVRAVNAAGIDALAWNFRSCSEEPNRCFRLYHNGATDDLDMVVRHAAETYSRIFLVGFSMGGNLSLLYLGKHEFTLPHGLKGCVVFSVPCDLTDAAMALERRENSIYMKRFLKLLREKVKMKQMQFPGRIDDLNYEQLKTFKDFDDRYTAPLHGFDSAEDYWQKCSSGPWLAKINVPTLIVNSNDDPFLQGGCYPVEQCRKNPVLSLEITHHGGHVGFVGAGNDGIYWSERRAVLFLSSLRSD
jgi:predicted alpha/beta-fold hydrolase